MFFLRHGKCALSRNYGLEGISIKNDAGMKFSRESLTRSIIWLETFFSFVSFLSLSFFSVFSFSLFIFFLIFHVTIESFATSTFYSPVSSAIKELWKVGKRE